MIEVLRDRPDADRVSAVLVELHPAIAQRARDAAVAAGPTGIEVRATDAGRSDAYTGAVSAQVVLLVGIFGNICENDLWRLLAFAPQLCAPGATLLWSRGLDGSDRNDPVRARLADAGFTELDYATSGGEDAAALGVVRYDGPPVALQLGQSLSRSGAEGASGPGATPGCRAAALACGDDVGPGPAALRSGRSATTAT